MALYLGSNKVAGMSNAGGGVATDNYVLDEEQVVGTWVNGKPLYRMVKQYTLAEPAGYPSYPSFDTGIRDLDFAMIDAYLTNGDNLQYSRNLGSFHGYLSTNGRYTFILQTPTTYELTALPGLYTFIIHYTKTTD